MVSNVLQILHDQTWDHPHQWHLEPSEKLEHLVTTVFLHLLNFPLPIFEFLLLESVLHLYEVSLALKALLKFSFCFVFASQNFQTSSPLFHLIHLFQFRNLPTASHTDHLDQCQLNYIPTLLCRITFLMLQKIRQNFTFPYLDQIDCSSDI